MSLRARQGEAIPNFTGDCFGGRTPPRNDIKFYHFRFRHSQFVIRRNGKRMNAAREIGKNFVVMKFFLSGYVRLQLLGDGRIESVPYNVDRTAGKIVWVHLDGF